MPRNEQSLGAAAPLTPLTSPSGAFLRRPSKYDLCAGTGRIVRPIVVDAHERFDCVTGGDALNLVDPEIGHPADWHDFCWRCTDNPPRRAAHAGDVQYRVVAKVLGGDRTFDGREALRNVYNPAALRSKPVWCAHHDRAIVERAWLTWAAGAYASPWPLAPSVVDDWIWTPEQMASLKALAERVEPHLPAAARSGWRKWYREQLEYGIGR